MNTIYCMKLSLKRSKENAAGIFNALLSVLTNKDNPGQDVYMKTHNEKLLRPSRKLSEGNVRKSRETAKN